jgi:S-formylglutathione hydrolase FrmB
MSLINIVKEGADSANEKNIFSTSRWTVILVTVSLIVFALFEYGYSEVSIEVVLGTKVAKQSVSGRLYVLMNSDTLQLPLYGPNSSDPQPFFSTEISNWNPGHAIAIDSTWNFWRHSLEGLSGFYSISAVLDRDSTSWGFINAANYMSVNKVIYIDQSNKNSIRLELEAEIVAYPFTETATLKELIIPSPMLSKWYDRPVELSAGVILPPSYHDSTGKKYPVVYVFPGWGASRFHLCMGTFQQERYGMLDQIGCEKIFVFLDHQCPYGYHVFANSENNGPRAEAFIKELVPTIESELRVISQAGARFLVGQSSGGWAALYLQITYPDYFGGAWAGSPDPVNFRFFEGIGNIYDENNNFFYESDGSDKPHSRLGGQINVTSKTFSDMETVLGIGGQLGSYESVFSNRLANGKPAQLFDRTTGIIDQEAAAYWEKSDLRLIIENHTPDQRSKYDGKLHIFVSNEDDYYLNLAVEALKKYLESLNFNADINILDTCGHSVWNDEIRARMYAQMDTIFMGLGSHR